MRKLLLLAVFAVVPSLAFGQVVAKVEGGDGVTAYRAAVKKVQNGERVTVVLGAEDGMLKPGETAYRYTKYTASAGLADYVPGVYEFYMGGDGQIKGERRLAASAVNCTTGTCSGGVCTTGTCSGGVCTTGTCSAPTQFAQGVPSYSPVLAPSFSPYGYVTGGCANGSCQPKFR